MHLESCDLDPGPQLCLWDFRAIRAKDNATNTSRLSRSSLVLQLGPSSHEKQRQHCMQQNCRPQNRAVPLAAESDVKKTQGSKRAVGQHPANRAGRSRRRPAGNSQCNQGDACEAANHEPNIGNISAEQQLDDDRWIHQQGEAGDCLGHCSDREHPVLHFKTPRCVESSKTPRRHQCCTARPATPMLAVVSPRGG